MCLTHCDVSPRFVTKPKREAISRSANLLRDLFHAINRMIAKSLHLLPGVLSARFLALISASNCAREYEYEI